MQKLYGVEQDLDRSMEEKVLARLSCCKKYPMDFKIASKIYVVAVSFFLNTDFL